MKVLFCFTATAFVSLAGHGLLAQSTSVASADPSSIALLTLNQPPCVTLTPQSMLRAKVAYRLAECVSIKFIGYIVAGVLLW